jgi:hypothetical protein
MIQPWKTTQEWNGSLFCPWMLAGHFSRGGGGQRSLLHRTRGIGKFDQEYQIFQAIFLKTRMQRERNITYHSM